MGFSSFSAKSVAMIVGIEAISAFWLKGKIFLKNVARFYVEYEVKNVELKSKMQKMDINIDLERKLTENRSFSEKNN